jgi:predicted HTH domain antitoxin
MTTVESINQYVQMLPDLLQEEVLDFVKYLLFKREQYTPHPDDQEWSNLSLELAMRGMEDEEMPDYTPADLEQALAQYRQGGLSFRAAARQAGVSYTAFAQYAYAQGIEPPYSNETLAEELGQAQ